MFAEPPTPGATSPAAGPTVTFVVPVHRDSPAFRRALGALVACDPPADELVIAVDGPHDDLVALALQHGARVVQLAVGCGPAVARNAGARLATGDLLFFVDADVVVPPHVVGLARRHFLADPGLSAVIGTYDDEPDQPNFFSQYKNLLNHHVHQSARVEGSTFWGACGVVRRSTFTALRGFDHRYPRPTIEDIELGYRIVGAGERIHVAKDLQVKHLKRWTGPSLLRSDVRDRALPWSALIVSSGTLPDDLNVDTRSRLSAVLAALLAACLLGAVLVPGLLLTAPLLLAGLVWLDRPVVRFFTGRRGAWFAARAMAWQVLYHLYSAVSFAIAVAHPMLGSPVHRWRARRYHREKARARKRAGSPEVTVRLGDQVLPSLVSSVRQQPAGRIPVPVAEYEPAPAAIPQQAGPKRGPGPVALRPVGHV
jgi:GT2 family glycosyltransferase